MSFDENISGRSAADYADFLLPHLTGEMVMLDGGCGAGTITVGLAEHVASIVGIDHEDNFSAATEYATAAGIGGVSFQTGDLYSLTTQHLGFDEGKLDSNITENEINRIAKAVQESNLRSHLVAEINLARFIRGVSEVLKAKASNLINRLKEYKLALG